MGNNDSFLSILILLVLFFVLPPVLKLLGRYTLNSKEQAERPEPLASAPADPADYSGHFTSESGLHAGEAGHSYKPINPKWF